MLIFRLFVVQRQHRGEFFGPLKSRPLNGNMTSSNGLPTGGKVFSTLPDLFFIPEFIFGGLVWTLVASTRVWLPNPLGWVMFVSIFCFVFTTLWFFIFISGANQSSIWPGLDVAYHFIATVFYLSAAVVLAYITIGSRPPDDAGQIAYILQILGLTVSDDLLKIYREEIAAVVMAFMATLLYFIHTILSALRWKSP